MTPSLPSQLMTGIQGIDDQHRALIHWAGTINRMDGSNGGRPLVIRAAKFLIAYTKYHFDSEEYAMVASGYDGVAQHRREHAMMRRQLSELAKAINQRQKSAEETIVALQGLIQGWIQNHISGTDFAFARYCEQEPDTRFLQLPSPKELRDTGFNVSDFDEVEAVHHAGEITPEELASRLKKR